MFSKLVIFTSFLICFLYFGTREVIKKYVTNEEGLVRDVLPLGSLALFSLLVTAIDKFGWDRKFMNVTGLESLYVTYLDIYPTNYVSGYYVNPQFNPKRVNMIIFTGNGSEDRLDLNQFEHLSDVSIRTMSIKSLPFSFDRLTLHVPNHELVNNSNFSSLSINFRNNFRFDLITNENIRDLSVGSVTLLDLKHIERYVNPISLTIWDEIVDEKIVEHLYTMTKLESLSFQTKLQINVDRLDHLNVLECNPYKISTSKSVKLETLAK